MHMNIHTASLVSTFDISKKYSKDNLNCSEAFIKA